MNNYIIELEGLTFIPILTKLSNVLNSKYTNKDYLLVWKDPYFVVVKDYQITTESIVIIAKLINELRNKIISFDEFEIAIKETVKNIKGVNDLSLLDPLFDEGD